MADREKGQFLEPYLIEYLSKGDDTDENSTPFRYKIRERAKGVLDQLGHLGAFLNPKDVDMIFHQYHPSENEDLQGWDEINRVTQFKDEITHALAFLFEGVENTPDMYVAMPYKKDRPGDYTALVTEQEFFDHAVHELSEEERKTAKFFEPGPDIEFGLESVIEEALQIAYEKRGEKITRFNIDIETEPVTPIDELVLRFENGDTSLTHGDLMRLYDETDISGKEIQEWNRDIQR